MSVLDEDHKAWKPGDVVVNLNSGSARVVVQRKTARDVLPLPGWWVNDVAGQPAGGIADVASGWCSLRTLLAAAHPSGGGES